jgi:hypothetical protein
MLGKTYYKFQTLGYVTRGNDKATKQINFSTLLLSFEKQITETLFCTFLSEWMCVCVIP